jgi:hypothetical protein
MLSSDSILIEKIGEIGRYTPFLTSHHGSARTITYEGYHELLVKTTSGGFYVRFHKRTYRHSGMSYVLSYEVFEYEFRQWPIVFGVRRGGFVYEKDFEEPLLIECTKH